MNESHYFKVQQFNSLGGNLETITKQSLALQLDLIQEEYLETVEAFDNQDSTEFVDGVADMYVVVTGLIQKLERMGVNMKEAIDRVCDNNLQKFPLYQDGWQDIIPEGCSVNTVDGRLVIKKITTGKIMKPLNFKPVDLTNVPDFFKAIGGVV